MECDLLHQAHRTPPSHRGSAVAKKCARLPPLCSAAFGHARDRDERAGQARQWVVRQPVEAPRRKLQAVRLDSWDAGLDPGALGGRTGATDARLRRTTRAAARDLRQTRVGQPGMVGQGAAGAAHDRAGGASRRHQARHGDHRIVVGEHGDRHRDGRGDEGLHLPPRRRHQDAAGAPRARPTNPPTRTRPIPLPSNPRSALCRRSSTCFARSARRSSSSATRASRPRSSR